jgi:hypothetical protein
MTNGWPCGRSQHRTILILDIEGYSAEDRDDSIRVGLRARLRELMTKVLVEAGIDDSRYTTQSTGDGLLVTIDPLIGKPRILGPLVDGLATSLREQNRATEPAERMRVRLVVHAADVLIDPDGPLGDQVNFAFRLLDAELLRVLLKHASGPLVVCVSDAVYRQVIAQRHEGLDPADFEGVWLESRNVRGLGWVHAPGECGLAARAGLLTPVLARRSSRGTCS